jgi:hypothetical protein
MGAGEHGKDRFGNHRHSYSVAFADAAIFEDLG